MVKIIRNENNTIASKSSIIELLNALSRYYSGRRAKNTHKKLLRIGLGKVDKIENISKNKLNQVETL